MARLRKSHHTVLPRCSSPEADSMDDDLQDHVHYSQDTPNDLSDGDNLPRDDNFDKALIDFYMKHKLKSLKRKITSSRMNKEYANKYHQAKRTRQEKSYATISTRYSGTYFSSVLSKLTPRQKEVITKYGMGCLLKFVKTDAPLRFVKWIAGKFIPVTKQTMPDCEAGRNFLLSHFNLTSIPTVNFFANKLYSEEQLSDEDIFICFMAVAFTCFLCPNSSLQPSTQYFHIFRNCDNVRSYDLSKFVYDWLITSISSFQSATKITSKRSVTFGGCHYTLAVIYRLAFWLDVEPGGWTKRGPAFLLVDKNRPLSKRKTSGNEIDSPFWKHRHLPGPVL